jgi:hypothetical protein
VAGLQDGKKNGETNPITSRDFKELASCGAANLRREVPVEGWRDHVAGL